MNGYGSFKAATAVIGLAVLLFGGNDPNASRGGNQALGFNANLVDGFSGGRAIEVTGGGVYRVDRTSANSGGGFRCLSNIATGPFTGCQDGADCYRHGDGNVESFTAKMIVSALDLDPVAGGLQNVWVQGIGCGTDAVTSFN